MDAYCIQLGYMLDNGLDPLRFPEEHTVHCLVDVGVCRNSGFVVLINPKDDEDRYTQGYRLDSNGTMAITQLARAVGSCGTCHPTGTLVSGLRAGIMGTVVDVSSLPPTITVDKASYLEPGEEYCPEVPSRPTNRRTTTAAPTTAPTAQVIERGSAHPMLPMFTRGFNYQSQNAYGLHDEADTEAALPDEWKGVERLVAGFPDTISKDIKPASSIADGAGGFFDISEPLSKELLAQIREKYAKGEGLEWYFLPEQDRYRSGPGLTGDEILADVQEGRFVTDSPHTTFIYGFFQQNVMDYYRLYRVSGDSLYLDQIVKYAEAADWLLKHQPRQFIPIEERDNPMPDPVSVIPHEPAALANFWAHVNAGRLLLERARENGATDSDPDVVKGKGFLQTAINYMAKQITAEYYQDSTFVEGDRTRLLRSKFLLPQRAAQVIEYTPWNQTFFYLVTLIAAARGLEDLQAIEGGASWQGTIDLYKNIVRAGIWNFEEQNICVVREGIPYFFHMHTALRDRELKTRLGFPMYGGEDIAHSGSGAVNLPYIWESGPDFGVSPALLAGYANAMVAHLNDPSEDKKGRAWPRNHLDSPWYLAASGRKNYPAARLADNYYPLMPFTPEIVAANRPYSSREKVWSEPGNLLRLYAGYLYRKWLVRQN